MGPLNGPYSLLLTARIWEIYRILCMILSSSSDLKRMFGIGLQGFYTLWQTEGEIFRGGKRFRQNSEGEIFKPGGKFSAPRPKYQKYSLIFPL